MTPHQTLPRDRNGLAVLDRAACLDLLATVPVGRVAVTIGALPVILPVNFALGPKGEVVFRTGEGQKLKAALDGAVIAFEADDFDEDRRTGWSVLVQDQARVISAENANGYGELGLETWAGIEPTEFVVLGTELISGRRLDGARR